MRDCCGLAGMAGGRTVFWSGGGGGKYRLFANLLIKTHLMQLLMKCELRHAYFLYSSSAFRFVSSNIAEEVLAADDMSE